MKILRLYFGKTIFWVGPLVCFIFFPNNNHYLEEKLMSEGSEKFIVFIASTFFGAGKILEII